MRGRDDETEKRTDTEPAVERRDVLSGVGGGFTAVAGTQLVSDDTMGPLDRFRWNIKAMQVSRTYGSLAEPDDDPSDLVGRLDDEQTQALAEKGRELYALTSAGGECGPEGYEIDGGRYNHCCGIHDSCCSGQSTTECIGNIGCWGVFGACVALS